VEREGRREGREGKGREGKRREGKRREQRGGGSGMVRGDGVEPDSYP
jgi:hypothetical protein